MSTGGSRVSIPSSVRKTIQNIKEIAGNHSDEEIYAMLKECSMDPNDTAQKLLYQDTFHEVKRKRDKRKENQNNKDSAESRWRSGMQGQVGRGGRGNQSPRYVNHDAGGGRNASIRKENGINLLLERGVSSSHVPASKDVGTKAPTHLARSGTSMTNVSSNVAHGSTTVPCVSGLQAGIDTNFPEAPSSVNMNKLETGSRLPPPVNAKIAPLAVSLKQELSTSNSDNLASPVSVLGVSSSVSDHVLVPSLDSWLPGTVGTMKREVGGQWGAVESNSMTSVECKSATSQDFVNHAQISKAASENVTELSSSMTEKAASEVGDSFMHGKMPGKSLGIDRNRLVDTAQIQFTSIHGGNMSGRPPSNYISRSQQLIVSQKAVGPSKEWKPKPVNPNSVPSSGTVGLSDTASIAAEADSHSQPASAASASEEETLKLQTRLEELHFSDNQQVIIPNHLQVPEAERTGLSFGSFDASFGMSATYAGGADTEKSSTPASESSHMLEESIEEPCSSQVASPTDQEGDYHDHLQSPTKVQENISTVETDGPSNAVPEYDQTKLESVLPVGGPQYSVVHTTPNYSTFGLMPPILGTQFAPFDSSEPQARDISRIPGFIVQQRFDPSSSFFPQFYRPSAEGDGRFSPFLAPAAAAKYNGNVAVLSPQSGQSPQEGGNSLVISTAGPTPLVTQAAGVVQNSIGVTQQSLPVFRQPAGVHLPHYPPNYMPYSQYLSPFYVPPPAIHQFLSSTSFPQQPPSGNIYPPSAAGATAAAGVKYPISQYKPGNTGSSTHVAMPTSYAPYSSSPACYGPSPAPTTDNSTGNEDLSASQFKENNVYITGQQSEGSTVWIPALGREISGLQTNSFYNLSPQGQHVAFTPAQAGHGALTGIYHPAQTVAAATVHPLLQQSQTMAGAVEMVGPPSGVYQQPQHAQINWTNNY